MKYFFNHIIVIGFIFTIVGKINAQHLYYPKQNQTFVQYKWNNLTVQDSSTLLNFNLKINGKSLLPIGIATIELFGEK